MLRLIGFLLTLCLGAPAAGPVMIVLHKGASSMGFYTPEGKALATVPVGKHPHEMVLSADGRLAYVSDNGTMRIEEAGTGGNTVSIVDLVARKKAGEISLGKFHRPHGLDLNHETGLLAVSTELPDQLVVVDVKTRRIVKTFDTNGKTAHMVAWGPGARWAYVCNSSSANVAAIERATGKVKLIPAGERPEGSVLSHDGRFVYVVNRESHGITIIDTAKNEAAGEIRTGKGPVRIALTPDGRTLVYALMHDRKVEFADAAARRVIGQVSLGGRPVSLGLSSDGKLAFASAQDDDTVYVVSVAEKKVIRQIRTAKGTAPDPALQIQVQ